MSGRWFPLEPPRESGRPLPSSAPKRPLTVTISLWLYVAASALSLVGMVIGVIEFPAAREAAEREAADQGKQLPEGYLDVFNTSAVMGVLAALIFAGVFV